MKTKRQQIIESLSTKMNKMDMYVINLMNDEQLMSYYEKMTKTVSV
jgi:hypothetical protein